MGALSRAAAGREVEDEWLARCRPRRGEEDLLAPLIEALRRLQRAQSVDDRMDRVDATLGCITEVERVLRVRLDVWLDANPERAKGAQKTAANKQSYEAFSRYRSERRRGLEERKLPSLHSIGYWFYGASRLEPAELRDELSVALGLRSGRDGDTGDELAEQVWLLGELRNALAHRGDYELGAPKRDPRLDELVVKTATGLDVKPGVQSLVRSVALRLHGYEGAFDTLTFTLEQRDGGPRASVVREQSSDERARDEGAQAQVSGVVTRRRKAPSTGSNDDGESVGWLAWAALGLGGLAVCVALAVLYLDHVRAAETTPAEPQSSASARASAIPIPGDARAGAGGVGSVVSSAGRARPRRARWALRARGRGALVARDAAACFGGRGDVARALRGRGLDPGRRELGARRGRARRAVAGHGRGVRAGAGAGRACRAAPRAGRVGRDADECRGSVRRVARDLPDARSRGARGLAHLSGGLVAARGDLYVVPARASVCRAALTRGLRRARGRVEPCRWHS